MNPTFLQECQTRRREELEVLQSIFPEMAEIILRQGSTTQIGENISLHLPVTFASPVSVRIESPVSTIPGAHLKVVHLPAITVSLYLPSEYPLNESAVPYVTSIRTNPNWLGSALSASIVQQVRKLIERSEISEGVLWNLSENIQSGEVLSDIGAWSRTRGEICIVSSTPELLAQNLELYNQRTAQSSFNVLTFSCTICLEDIKGHKAVSLSCNHTFCKPCLATFWSSCLATSDLNRITCADPACVKRGALAVSSEVWSVLSEAEATKWEQITLTRKFSLDPTAIQCCLNACGAWVVSPNGALPLTEEMGDQKLRICPRCSYTFCAMCKKSWHGSVQRCDIPITENIVLQYLGAPSGSVKRIRLEKIYGAVELRQEVVKLLGVEPILQRSKGDLGKLALEWWQLSETSTRRRAIALEFGQDALETSLEQLAYRELDRLALLDKMEQQNEQFLSSSTWPCPSCGVPIVKDGGCSSMWCTICRSSFTWRGSDKATVQGQQQQPVETEESDEGEALSPVGWYDNIEAHGRVLSRLARDDVT